LLLVLVSLSVSTSSWFCSSQLVIRATLFLASFFFRAKFPELSPIGMVVSELRLTRVKSLPSHPDSWKITQISLQLAEELVLARVAGLLFQCKIPGAKNWFGSVEATAEG